MVSDSTRDVARSWPTHSRQYMWDPVAAFDGSGPLAGAAMHAGSGTWIETEFGRRDFLGVDGRRWSTTKGHVVRIVSNPPRRACDKVLTIRWIKKILNKIRYYDIHLLLFGPLKKVLRSFLHSEMPFINIICLWIMVNFFVTPRCFWFFYFGPSTFSGL